MASSLPTAKAVRVVVDRAALPPGGGREHMWRLQASCAIQNIMIGLSCVMSTHRAPNGFNPSATYCTPRPPRTTHGNGFCGLGAANVLGSHRRYCQPQVPFRARLACAAGRSLVLSHTVAILAAAYLGQQEGSHQTSRFPVAHRRHSSPGAGDRIGSA